MGRRNAAAAMTTPGASSRGRLVMATSDLQDLITPLVNAFPNPVFVKDDAHRILLFNDAFCAMLGRPRSELIGKGDFDLVPAEEARVYWERDDAVFRTGHTLENEEAPTDATGLRHWILNPKSLITLPDGHPYPPCVNTNI